MAVIAQRCASGAREVDVGLSGRCAQMLGGARNRGASSLCRVPPEDEVGGITMISGPTAAALVEWRESVAAIYSDVRATHDSDPRGAWLRFRERRDRLYKRHPCSALTDAEKQSFTGFGYNEYDPNLCLVREVEYAVAEYSLE